MRDRLNKIYAKHTGQDIDCIKKCMQRFRFMGSEEAHDWGLIDEVIEHHIVLSLLSKGAIRPGSGLTKINMDSGEHEVEESSSCAPTSCSMKLLKGGDLPIGRRGDTMQTKPDNQTHHLLARLT